LNNLSTLYDTQGRYADAEPLFKRSLAIQEKSLGPDHPFVATSLKNLAFLYQNQGRYSDAEPLCLRSLAIREKSFGPDHPDVANLLNNLAGLYYVEARYSDAEPLFKRSLGIFEKALSPDHPEVANSLNNLARLYREQGRWPEALPLVRAATERGYVNRSVPVHLSVLLGAKRAKDLSEDEAVAESFVVVQLAASTAASAALSQLAVRFSAGTDDLAQLVRKDQDLSTENERLDKDLIAAVSKPPDQRDANRETATRKRLEDIAAARNEVGRILAQRFPDYAALSKPQPLSVSDVSALLTDDEALILVDLGKRKADASYIWAVDRSGAVWNTIDAKPEDLEIKIAALRASLDPNSNKPFDAKLSYELYKLVLGPVEDRIAKKPRLLMVMNGALTSLPPQVLVTRDPAGLDLKSTDWLIRRSAVCLIESILSDRLLSNAVGANQLPGPPETAIKSGLGNLIKSFKIYAGKNNDEEATELADALDAWRDRRNTLVHGAVKCYPMTSPKMAPSEFWNEAALVAHEGVGHARRLLRWRRAILRTIKAPARN
jgi:tetratricopeptide (TPR) repeat protein